MPSTSLDQHNRGALLSLMTDDAWVISCLCAGWCGSCREYQAIFNALASLHPDKQFIWIDIEDQADVVGELDIDNFPTLLIQRGDIVAFFGTVQPDLGLAQRLLMAQVEQSNEQLHLHAISNDERKQWQSTCNLRVLLSNAA